MSNVIGILARVLMSQLFIVSGLSKLMAYGGSAGYFASLGIPMASLVLPLVIVIELGGGLALLFGFKTRWVAAVLAAFTVGSALVAHMHFADQMQMIQLMKNLAIAGGLLLFVQHGAGSASVDAR